MYAVLEFEVCTHLLSTLAERFSSLAYCTAGKLLAYHGSEASCMHKDVQVNVHWPGTRQPQTNTLWITALSCRFRG